jgi:polar amino acid transport system permease protein
MRLAPDGFIQGAALTIFVTAFSMFFASLVALVTALGRLSTNPVAFAVATFYASLFRGTPLLVQVLIIYLALPQIGIVLGALSSGLIALSLNYGAYLAETIRSGVMAVPPGQGEAATALGLPRWVIAWKVTGPQALRLIIPTAGALFVSMLKDSSLVSLMGLWELNFLAQSYARATYHYMEMLIAAALIYWALSIVFELVQFRLERRFDERSNYRRCGAAAHCRCATQQMARSGARFAQCVARRRQARTLGRLRPIGIRQIDSAAVPERSGVASIGPHRHRRHRTHGRGEFARIRAARGRHGVPVL